MTELPTSLISPHFVAEKLDSPSVEDLIDVLEDRVTHWMIEPAKALADHPIFQVPAFALVLTYFEGIWSYIEGRDSRGQSHNFFVSGFVDVFRSGNVSEKVLARIGTALYEDARCGFFHDGAARDRIYFGEIGESAPLVVTVPEVDGVVDEDGEIQSILVDPSECLRYVEGHFRGYIGRLRNPEEEEARRRFVAVCRQKWAYDTPPRFMSL